MSSLAIYIHWPFCKSKCPYCDFNSHVRESVDQERWKKALLQELEHMVTQVPEHTATSIFFGGGTPSLMPPQTAEALITRVHELWPVAQDIEITLEANPTSVETTTFSDFKHAGINRVSLGVQSLDDKELRFLGRGHSSAEALKAIESAAKIFDRYTFDLIYARPNQTLENWEKELLQALTYARGHLSLYQLTIEENTAFHHAYKKGEFALPDEELSEALYRMTENIMQSHGLSAYEVSNYAAKNQASRHNLSYWKGDDYIGVGPGAHGRLTKPSPLEGEGWEGGNVFYNKENNPHPLTPSLKGRGNVRFATVTLKSPERWLEKVEKTGNGLEVFEPVDKNTEIAERVMMGLRLTEGINFQNFKDKTGIPFESAVNMSKYALYVQKKLLKVHAGGVATTLAGRLLLNRLTAELLQ